MGPFKWTPSVSIREGFGKTNASAQMLFTSGQPWKWTGIITLEGEEKKNCNANLNEGKKKFLFWGRKSRRRGERMTSDCISRDGEFDSVLYLQSWEVQPMGHKTFLTWIWVVILSQCKQILNVDTHTLSQRAAPGQTPCLPGLILRAYHSL